MPIGDMLASMEDREATPRCGDPHPMSVHMVLASIITPDDRLRRESIVGQRRERGDGVLPPWQPSPDIDEIGTHRTRDAKLVAVRQLQMHRVAM